MSLDLVGWNVVLDTNNADTLSSFYEQLLGWTKFPGEDFIVLANIQQNGFPTWITFQQTDEYLPPVWPSEPEAQQQMEHLDFHVQNVEQSVKFALQCGATLSDVQFDDRWRVMLDPSGHPFCLLPPPPWMQQN